MVVEKALKKEIWLLGLLDDLDVFDEHTNVHCDKSSWQRTKHIIR